MAFSYDIATNIGKVRRAIGDTVEDSAYFADEELQVYLTETSSNIYLAAARALTVWAAALAREDELVYVGAWRGDRRDVVGKMLRVAQSLTALGGLDEDIVFEVIPMFGLDAAERAS